jgi:ubiquinone/menaquinone biosynthesis C-methylase UbiE
MAEPAAIRTFYDDFMESRMLSYRLHGNIRVERAANFFTENISENSVVLDVGCGIGIGTEAIAKKAAKGQVFGLDISDRNIWYAARTVSAPNVSFHSVDIIEDAKKVEAIVKRPIDIFTLGDMIEHIPDDKRRRLFATMGRLGSPTARILITIPSEFYQRYLIAEKPEERQIIDNVITPGSLDMEGRDVGFVLTYYRLVDVWQPVQYAYCILQREQNLAERVRMNINQSPRSILRRLKDKAYGRRARKKKYVDNVFSKQ